MTPNECSFTGLPFGEGETSPEGDHCHETGLFNGHVFKAVNRALGAIDFILRITGWTIEMFCTKYKEYKSKPGKDLGLELYPTHLGFATKEEALAAFNNPSTTHTDEPTN